MKRPAKKSRVKQGHHSGGVIHLEESHPAHLFVVKGFTNMLAETISYVIGRELGGKRIIRIDMDSVRGELWFTFKGTNYANVMDPLVEVNMHVVCSGTGNVLFESTESLRLSDIAHFLSVHFDAEKPYAFKHKDPFYVISHDHSRAEGV